GGKTTLALSVLKKDQKIRLISDDVCFVDFKNYTYPLMLRIGTRGRDSINEIPEKYITKIHRSFYGEKYLIDLSYFKNKISGKSKACNILIGKRVFQEETQIRSVSKIRCFSPFIQSGVFGLGLPRIVELFLRGNFLDTIKKINMIVSRSLLFSAMVCRANIYEIRIGRNVEKSTRELINFINKAIEIGVYRKEEMFKKAIEINPENDRLKAALAISYEERGEYNLAEEYSKKTEKLRTEHYSPITRHDYNRLNEIVTRRGIKHVCVQYPTRSVEPLKRIFDEKGDVIFVNNEKFFKEAVRREGYTEYFVDMLAGDFGHATKKGNRLLAENIANTILKECGLLSDL
ncbi:MAG: tetratricopeptide repeat protein, partial [Candidatus Orphnella occulta]|nr:tetratricopeptide repeat protein [Candidatus Orphnella occulta]